MSVCQRDGLLQARISHVQTTDRTRSDESRAAAFFTHSDLCQIWKCLLFGSRRSHLDGMNVPRPVCRCPHRSRKAWRVSRSHVKFRSFSVFPSYIFPTEERSMPHQPRASVVMAAFNCEKYIDEAISSVLDQTETNIELIVVDDGSADETLSIANRHAQADCRVRVFSQPPSGRPGVCRNIGIRHAKGEHICFLDADDWYEPSRVRRCLDILDRMPRADVVFHDMLYATADSAPLSGSYLSDTGFLDRSRAYMIYLDNRRYCCSTSFYEFMSAHYAAMHTNTVMIRRTALDESQLRFPEDVAIGEDTDLWLRLAKSMNVVYLDERLSYYRQHGAGITADRERKYRDLLVVHVRNYDRGRSTLSPECRRKYRSRIADLFLSQGYLYWTQGRIPEARRAYRESFVWSPSAKALRAQAKALLPHSLARLLKKAANDST